jgi:hypothetical protein
MWDAEQTGWFLNLSREDVLFLCRCDHLQALADPPPGAQRYFLGRYVLALGNDERWLKKAIVLLRENVASKNQAAKEKQAQAGTDTDADGGEQSAPRPNRWTAMGKRHE